jgi:hypothetical protein
MDYHGLSWIVDCRGLSWIIIDDGLSRIILDYHGVSWIIMDHHGLSQINVDSHGLSWMIMDYHGLSWITLAYRDYNGLSWILDYPQASQGISRPRLTRQPKGMGASHTLSRSWIIMDYGLSRITLDYRGLQIMDYRGLSQITIDYSLSWSIINIMNYRLS